MPWAHTPAVRTSFSEKELLGQTVKFSIGDGETQLGVFAARRSGRAGKEGRTFIWIEGELILRELAQYRRICRPRYSLTQVDTDRISLSPPGSESVFACLGIETPKRGRRDMKK